MQAKQVEMFGKSARFEGSNMRCKKLTSSSMEDPDQRELRRRDASAIGVRVRLACDRYVFAREYLRVRPRASTRVSACLCVCARVRASAIGMRVRVCLCLCVCARVSASAIGMRVRVSASGCEYARVRLRVFTRRRALACLYRLTA